MKLIDYYNKVKKGQIRSDINLQREIVYSSEEKALVIDSILNDIPLPAFYLWKADNNILEVLDGKQRTEAIKKFMNADLYVNGKSYTIMSEEEQKKIEETELAIIECSGTEEKRREIFYRINTLGKSLSEYEVINGLYYGTYLDGLTAYCKQDTVKKVFGDTNSRGKYQLAILKYIIDIKGIVTEDKNNLVQDYVYKNRDNDFEKDQKLVDERLKFIRTIFNKPSKHLKLYMKIAKEYYKSIAIWKDYKEEINKVITEFEKSVEYKQLNTATRDMVLGDKILAVVDKIDLDPVRNYTPEQKKELIARHGLMSSDGKCECKQCKKMFYPEELEMDHIIPWSKGGRTEISNAQLLCRTCNARKSNK